MRSFAPRGRRSRLLGSALLVVCPLFQGELACSSRDAPDPAARVKCCVRDPDPRGVSPFNCRDDGECSAGASCVRAPAGWSAPDFTRDEAGATDFSGCLDKGPRVCGLSDTRSGDRQALTRGFHVPAFQLWRADSERYRNVPAFTWDVPRNAAIVECALFGCRPTVRNVGNHDGVERLGIVNFGSCALAVEPFEPASGVFDLTNPANTYDVAPLVDEGDGCFAQGPRRISELSVGCWAFDTTGIVAATPLEPIDPAGILNYQDAFDLECKVPKSEKACWVAKTARLGACHEGSCLELCVFDSDCAPPDIVDGDGLASGGAGGEGGQGGSPAPKRTPSGKCLKTQNYVGVCVSEGS